MAQSEHNIRTVFNQETRTGITTRYELISKLSCRIQNILFDQIRDRNENKVFSSVWQLPNRRILDKYTFKITDKTV